MNKYSSEYPEKEFGLLSGVIDGSRRAKVCGMHNQHLMVRRYINCSLITLNTHHKPLANSYTHVAILSLGVLGLGVYTVSVCVVGM